MKTRRFLGFVVLTAIIGFTHVSCGGDDTTHTHAYGTAWITNSTQHWHECDCGEKSAVANHTPADGVCTVCQYETSGTPPTANAGANQNKTLADNLTVTLNGTASSGEIASYAWECASYTADKGTVSAAYTSAQVTALIANANKATATVAPRKAGTYVFKLTVADSASGSDTANVTVEVNGFDVQKEVEVTFPAFVAGATLSFEPEAYTPTIAGGGFVDDDVVYIVTDDQGNTWDSTTGYEVSVDPYTAPGTVTFTQTYKMSSTTIATQTITGSLVSLGGKRFGSININGNPVSAIPSITLELEKTVTELDTPKTVTQAVTVAAVPFTAGAELKFKIDTNNYTFIGAVANGFSTADLDSITYTLSSTNVVKDLSAYSNGNIPDSVYEAGDYPTITQTFSFNGKVVGNRKIVVERSPLGFANLHDYIPTEFSGEWYDTDFETIDAIPATTLNLEKTVTE